MSSDEATPSMAGGDIWRRPVIRPEAASTAELASTEAKEEPAPDDTEFVQDTEVVEEIAAQNKLGGGTPAERASFPPPPAALAPDHAALQPYTYPSPTAPPTIPPAPNTPSPGGVLTGAPAVLAGVPMFAPLGATVAAGQSLVAVGPVEAEAPALGRTRRRRIQLRTSVTVFLFAIGLALGAGLVRYQLSAPPAPTDSFPALARSAIEPQPAEAVAQNLERNDVHGLAQLVDGDTLTAIQSQLSPLVTIDQVTFIGATVLGEDTIAGYVVRGRDQGGNLGIVGLTIRVRDGQVVAQ